MTAFDSGYKGRFAPSPTGPLHYGSLYTAVASFLQARSKGGKWLVRIDDLDPVRCKQTYSSKILRTLEQFGLIWDEDIFYQRARQDAYLNTLDQLIKRQLLYPCQCSRKVLADRGILSEPYDGYCLTHTLKSNQPSALRIQVPNKKVSLMDSVQGFSQQDLRKQVGDFIMFRKDQVCSYHLAVVLDDDTQGITEVLRGYDLLDSTYRQIYLQQLLHIKTPNYAHIPVICDAGGIKLSKQTFAGDISLSSVNKTLFSIFGHLNLNPPQELLASNKTEILNWGVEHWSLKRIHPEQSLPFKAD